MWDITIWGRIQSKETLMQDLMVPLVGVKVESPMGRGDVMSTRRRDLKHGECLENYVETTVEARGTQAR